MTLTRQGQAAVAAIREGRVTKRYLALIMGRLPRSRLTVDAPLRKSVLQGGERMVQVDPDAKLPTEPKEVLPPKPEGKIESAALQGSWSAQRDSAKFDMTLKADGTFSWKFTQGGAPQEVTGVWHVQDDGVLALEMNDQGVMLAQVILKGSQLDFYMLGDSTGAPPLKFQKQA